MCLITLRGSTVVGAVALTALWPASRAAAQAGHGNVIVYLDPMTTAGVGGTVNLAPSGQATKFEVTLHPGDTPNQSGAYKVRVVEGSCSTPGKVVEDFDEVHADGKAIREAGHLRLADVRGDHVIQVAAKRKDEVVACGMIPAER